MLKKTSQHHSGLSPSHDKYLTQRGSGRAGFSISNDNDNEIMMETKSRFYKKKNKIHSSNNSLNHSSELLERKVGSYNSKINNITNIRYLKMEQQEDDRKKIRLKILNQNPGNISGNGLIRRCIPPLYSSLKGKFKGQKYLNSTAALSPSYNYKEIQFGEKSSIDFNSIEQPKNTSFKDERRLFKEYGDNILKKQTLVKDIGVEAKLGNSPMNNQSSSKLNTGMETFKQLKQNTKANALPSYLKKRLTNAEELKIHVQFFEKMFNLLYREIEGCNEHNKQIDGIAFDESAGYSALDDFGRNKNITTKLKTEMLIGGKEIDPKDFFSKERRFNIGPKEREMKKVSSCQEIRSIRQRHEAMQKMLNESIGNRKRKKKVIVRRNSKKYVNNSTNTTILKPRTEFKVINKPTFSGKQIDVVLAKDEKAEELNKTIQEDRKPKDERVTNIKKNNNRVEEHSQRQSVKQSPGKQRKNEGKNTFKQEEKILLKDESKQENAPGVVDVKQEKQKINESKSLPKTIPETISEEDSSYPTKQERLANKKAILESLKKFKPPTKQPLGKDTENTDNAFDDSFFNEIRGKARSQYIKKKEITELKVSNPEVIVTKKKNIEDEIKAGKLNEELHYLLEQDKAMSSGNKTNMLLEEFKEKINSLKSMGNQRYISYGADNYELIQEELNMIKSIRDKERRLNAFTSELMFSRFKFRETRESINKSGHVKDVYENDAVSNVLIKEKR